MCSPFSAETINDTFIRNSLRRTFFGKSTCCATAKTINVLSVFRRTSKCSKLITLGWKRCSCESLMVCKFVVVSATSSNRFEEASDFIG